MGKSVVPPIVPVRLKPNLPDGTPVDESDRVCHLVLLPGGGEAPPVLIAYCGATFAPGTADWLHSISGAPCLACLDRVPLPSTAVVRLFRSKAPNALVESEPDRVELAEWRSLGLEPEQKITARFVLLVMLQHPARPVSIATIATLLDDDSHTVSLILLLHAAIGWVQRIPLPDESSWVDRCYQLTELGTTSARRLLASGLTPTFAVFAEGLGLDVAVVGVAVTDGAVPDPGGCTDSPGGAPTGPHRAGDHHADGETA